jgi:hypothetical protein
MKKRLFSMESLHIIPSWFLGINILFECLFFIFAAAISAYSVKIYRLANQRESKIFAWAFGFLAVSHLLLLISNSLFLSITQGGMSILAIEDILDFKNFIVWSYVSFFVLGFLTLLYLSLKIKSARVYSLLVALSAIALVASHNLSFLAYSLAAIFLAFISYHYFVEFKRTHNKNTLNVMNGFILLFVSNLLIGLVADYGLPSFYVTANILEIIGYSFIVYSLLNVLKYGEKKK